MATRVIAWAVAIGLGWGAWKAVNAWDNPWAFSAAAVPITAVLPALPLGCAAKDCAP